MDKQLIKDEPGIILGLLLIAILAGLLSATLLTGFEPGPMRPGKDTVLLGAYLMAWGAMFLASYYFSYKTFFFRALIWFCEHFSRPKGRWMALPYAAVAFLIGGFTMLTGLGLIESAA